MKYLFVALLTEVRNISSVAYINECDVSLLDFYFYRVIGTNSTSRYDAHSFGSS